MSEGKKRENFNRPANLKEKIEMIEALERFSSGYPQWNDESARIRMPRRFYTTPEEVIARIRKNAAKEAAKDPLLNRAI